MCNVLMRSASHQIVNFNPKSNKVTTSVMFPEFRDKGRCRRIVWGGAGTKKGRPLKRQSEILVGVTHNARRSNYTLGKKERRRSRSTSPIRIIYGVSYGGDSSNHLSGPRPSPALARYAYPSEYGIAKRNSRSGSRLLPAFCKQKAKAYLVSLIAALDYFVS